MESTPDTSAAHKRKRSDSSTTAAAAPPAKSAKSASSMSINYLARHSSEDLPLITKDETLPHLLNLLSAYSNILDRHESLASNLGARPLGPILIKRFERCFEAPPKVVASHHKNSTSAEESHLITWLEVIEFARSHPSQFSLSTFSEGRRVCQFYYPQKQLRVQISEEDFLFVNSGRCQELIPPLPIWEDEEKEVGTCDVLEVRLKELTNAADMIAARTRQLGHRLKGRRAAILERRAEGGAGTLAKAGAPQQTTVNGGFVAVNGNGSARQEPGFMANSSQVRSELLRHFESLPHNQPQGRTQSRHASIAFSEAQTAKLFEPLPPDHTATGSGNAPSTTSSPSPGPPAAIGFAQDNLSYYTTTEAPISRSNQHQHHNITSSSHYLNTSHTPLKHNFSRPLPPALESSQPFRPLCQSHMDALPRGHRVLPPCDRCRRLKMDCVKNLTSCAGCTRKHARCHWRDVTRDEVASLDGIMDTEGYDAASPGANGHDYGTGQRGESVLNGHGYPESDTGYGDEDDEDSDSNPLEDLEALGEREEQAARDEEGLEKARELARMSVEESIRDQERPIAIDGGVIGDGTSPNTRVNSGPLSITDPATEQSAADTTLTRPLSAPLVVDDSLLKTNSGAGGTSLQDYHEASQRLQAERHEPSTNHSLHEGHQAGKCEPASLSETALATDQTYNPSEIHPTVQPDHYESPKSPERNFGGSGGFHPVNGVMNGNRNAGGMDVGAETGWRDA